jgi:sn-glycerol 3-phosphate transport system substrate-binding protein
MSKRTLNRRDFLRLAGGLAAGTLVAACQPKTVVVEKEVEKVVTQVVKETVKETVVVAGTPKVMEKEVTKVVEKVVTATPPPPEPVTIDVQSGWCANAEAGCDVWTPAIQMFNEQYPDITVELIATGVSPEDMMTAMAGGVAPDVYHFYVGGWTELMARGVMFPLDDLIDGADYFDPGIYLPPQWEYCQWDGKIYGIPVLEGGANPAFSWHKPLLEEIGADAENGPQNWEQVLDWAKKLNQYDEAGNLVRVGYDPLDAWGVTVLNWTMAFDAPYISGDKRTMLFDQGNWRQGLEAIAQLWQDAGVEKVAAFNQEWGYWTGYESSGFGNGKRAMITNGVWQPGDMKKTAGTTGIDPTTIGYTWHPCLNEGKKYVNFGQEHTLFMPKLTDAPGESFKFMAHMTSVEVNLLEFDIRGACMWSKPILEVLDLDSIPGLRWFFDAPSEADTLFNPGMVNTPIQTQVESLWRRAVEEAIYGAKTPEQALVDINAELQQSLDEYWEAQG